MEFINEDQDIAYNTESLMNDFGELPNVVRLNTQVEYALELVKEQLSSFANQANFEMTMQQAFGDKIEVAALKTAWLTGEFRIIPEIEIRPAVEINGANGAYAAATNTIYLSQELLERNANNPDAVAAVLLEEVGHAVDRVLNESDSAGDEGDIFARLVQGETLTKEEVQQLKTENDLATVELDGQAVEIEQAFVESPTNPFYKYETVAVTGIFGFGSLGNSPSLNDKGNVAFTAAGTIGADDVYVFKSDSGLTNNITGFNRDFGSAVQINNNNQVVAVDRTFPLSKVRIWNGNSLGDFQTIAGDGFGRDFNEIFNFPSINNNGDVVFSALGGGNLFVPDATLVTNSDNSRFAHF